MTQAPPPAELSSDAPLEAVLASAMATGTSGRVEARLGKKKWIFQFVDGALVGTRSNLKSEHPDTVRAKKPGMSDAGVAKNCAMLRLRNAVKAATSWTWSDNPAVSEPTPLPGPGLLMRAVAGKGDMDAILAELGRESAVAVSGNVATLKLPGALAKAAAGWGDRTVSSVQQDGPGSAAERLAALWVGHKLGVFDVAAAAPAPEEKAAPTLDIASLLDGLGDSAAAGSGQKDDSAPSTSTGGGADAADSASDHPAGTNPWAPDKVLLPPEGTGSSAAPPAERPAEFEEAEIEAIGDGGPVKLDASFFEALNQRPDRETVRAAGFVHSSADAESPAEPEPEAHPLEAELRALAERLEGAEDHFAVLGVAWDAGAEAFRRAHLQLAQKLHPDRFTDASDEVQDLATETFDKVRAAWEVLGDETARGEYIDRVIHGKKSEDELAMEQVENYWAAEADFKRGLAAFHAGRIREAHERFEAAVEREGEELEFRAYLGFTTFQLHKSTDPDKAEVGKEMLKEVLEKNKEQERKLDQAWVLMGRVFRDLGNDKGARKCFVQALKINTGNADAKREMRRMQGGAPGSKKKEEAKKSTGGFFSRWFGGKKS